MASFYETLTEKQIEFIGKQHMFFTATAHSSGRINLSPKGMDSFLVLASNRVAYLDLMGSGNETCAHIQNDGRITVMLCSFDQAPNILRIYGRGEVIGPKDAQWDELMGQFESFPGQRQIVIIHVESTQDSCGWAIPRYEYTEERQTHNEFAAGISDEKKLEKIAAQTESIDGLPIVPTS
ncbi:MAG: pyridoxamine 5'-phosphate oxidase family protein [Candidatus Hydrogenedentota bacterium]